MWFIGFNESAPFWLYEFSDNRKINIVYCYNISLHYFETNKAKALPCPNT